MAQLLRLERLFASLAVLMAAVGAAIVIVQMLWISYGVLMRYVFRSPDRMATEATALLLFPVAFVGLAYALKENALPRVTIFTDMLPASVRRLVDIFNACVVFAIGTFFACAAIRGTFNSYMTGAASEILLWPRYLFWTPAALALLVFSAYSAIRTALLVLDPGGRRDEDAVV
ncbi:MAG: TRAP transporter small permease [Rhodospirillales bacterium]|nr:TRAP transporter small permease [Rhodospirillales bacterium]